MQTGARAFVHEVKRAAEAIGLLRHVGEKGAVLSPVDAAHWDLFLEDLRYTYVHLHLHFNSVSVEPD